MNYFEAIGHQKGREEGHQEGHQEGRREGHQEGRREGHQEGRQETLIEAFLRLARTKFRAVPRRMEKRLRNASLEQVDIWFDRLLTADTLDSVFEPTKS